MPIRNLKSKIQNPPNSPDEPAERYRSLSGLAVASLLFGILSPLVFVDWLLVIFPATAIVLAVLALQRIRARGGDWVGSGLARAGAATAIAFWILGYAWLWHLQAKEIPYGYAAVSYYDLQADPTVRGQWVPP